MPTFIRFENRIHLVAPNSGGDFSLCGVLSDDEGPELMWEPTTSTTVTCPDCVDIIRLCKGVKTRMVDAIR